MKRAYEIIIRFCEGREISFVDEMKETQDYDHVRRFYDGWLGDLKEKKACKE